MTTLWLIVLCGALAIAYAIWATRSVLQADAGSARMQEISAAVREGAQAYLKRQYSTIAPVGVVILSALCGRSRRSLRLKSFELRSEKDLNRGERRGFAE